MKKRAHPFAACIAIACALLYSSACKDQNKWIKSMGFVPLTPPSQLLSPGAVIMRKTQFGKMKLLCTAEESLGADFRPSQSRTVGGRYKRGSKVGWKLKGDALKQVQIAADSEDIREVFVQVENAKIKALTDVDILLAVGNRSAACNAAIKRRTAEGWDISIVSQSLTADVSYSVQFSSESSTDVSARLAQLQAVSVTLGGSFKATSDNSAAAKNLVWGLKDDIALAAIGSNDPDVVALRGQKAVRSNRTSIFLPDETLTAPKADETTQTDDDTSPSWGVTTAPAEEEAIPGAHQAFDGATAEDERTGQQIDEDDYADLVKSRQSDEGFVPTEGGAAAEDEGDAAPVNPRSSRH